MSRHLLKEELCGQFPTIDSVPLMLSFALFTGYSLVNAISTLRFIVGTSELIDDL